MLEPSFLAMASIPKEAYTRHKVMGSDATNVDDGFFTSLEEDGDEGLCTKEDATHVHLPRTSPFASVCVFDWEEAFEVASIVDDDVKTTEMLKDFGCRALDILLIRHVKLDLEYLGRRVLPIGSTFEDFCLNVVQNGTSSDGDVRSTCFCEGNCSPLANAFAGPCDEDAAAAMSVCQIQGVDSRISVVVNSGCEVRTCIDLAYL